MQKLDSLSRRWKMKSSSDIMLGLTSGKNEASLSTSWWKSVSASLSLMFWVFWKSTFKNHWGWQEVTLIIILQDWQFAIFPFDFTVTFFLHDMQERLFEACWTPIISPDTYSAWVILFLLWLVPSLVWKMGSLWKETALPLRQPIALLLPLVKMRDLVRKMMLQHLGRQMVPPQVVQLCCFGWWCFRCHPCWKMLCCGVWQLFFLSGTFLAGVSLLGWNRLP